MPATKAIGCPLMAAAVTGASAVVAMSAPPPTTVSRHCLPVVKLLTVRSNPCFSNSPSDLAMIVMPEIGLRFCASRAFINSAAAGSSERKSAINAAANSEDVHAILLNRPASRR